jgi:hypothetical protein
MLKNIYCILLFAISSISFGQTKEETSNWLTTKLNQHSSIVGSSEENYFFIKNGNIFEKSHLGGNARMNFTTIFGLPIKYITEITVSINPDSYTFNLYCGKNCISKSIDNIVGEIEQDTPKSLGLEINKKDITLVKRIPKALLFLVKSYGGNAKLIIDKEPF